MFDPSLYISLFAFKVTTITLTTTPQQLVNPDPNRVGLYINAPSAGFSVGLDPVVPVGVVAQMNVTPSLPFIMFWGRDGILPMQAWSGFTTAGTAECVITELTYQPERV
jgi:hypothetical protein